MTSVLPQLGPVVTLPNLKQVQSSKSAILPLTPALSTKVQQGHILLALKSSTLISVGELYDDNCNVLSRKNKVHVLKDAPAVNKLLDSTTPILGGFCNPNNRLWQSSITPSCTNKVSALPDGHHAILPSNPSPIYLPSNPTPLHSSTPPSIASKINTVMDVAKVTRDEAAIVPFKKKDNVDAAILSLVPSSNSQSPIPFLISDMEALISTNKCCTLVDQQLKLDKKYNIVPNYSIPFQDMNILIDKFTASLHHQSSSLPILMLSFKKIRPKVN